ncbi:MAG TPA: VOC family protein [Alphaproteobacteria bacterium]|nr:VOC family protein [Alphaproteobacteria bacterium]
MSSVPPTHSESPVWPAQLDHIARASDKPEALVAFYRHAINMNAHELGGGTWLLHGPQRRLLIAAGERGSQPLNAFRLQSPEQLAALRAWLAGRGIETLPNATPLFAEGLAVRDPDGRIAAFGLPDPKFDAPSASGLPGRLQHVVVATDRLDRLITFYERGLGFVASDHVYEEGVGNAEVTATFLRSDPEHHSFAAFRAPEVRPDHHSYETTCWNDIRDWADHMSRQNIKLWWGPGRHGPGNNLFFMVEDPEGYKVELSAELELMPRDMAARSWKHEQRTLNLWGQAWMRS